MIYNSNLNKKYINEIKNFENEKIFKKELLTKKDKKDYYFNTILKNIDINEGRLFLTKNIYEKLQNTLGRPQDFQRLKSDEKKRIQTKLNSLNYKEYSWKSPRKFVHDPALAGKINSESLKKFDELLKLYKNPTPEELKTQRS